MFFKKILNRIKCKISCCYKSQCSLNDEIENDYNEKNISSI